MSPAPYTDFITPRGFKYHCVFSLAAAGKSTLVFLHGFPSSTHDWCYQIAFFVKGSTAMLRGYTLSRMAADVISIMDKEGIKIESKVYVIGHDWGSALTSRLATFYPSRFTGFAFLVVGYSAPNPEFDIQVFYDHVKALSGRERFGYWRCVSPAPYYRLIQRGVRSFFAEDGADKIIANHMDAFMSILYPYHPKIWLTDMAPIAYVTEQDVKKQKAELLSVAPKENYVIKQSVFYGAALEDYVSVPEVALFGMQDVCPNLTVREYQTGHWVQLAAPDKVSSDLLEWIEGL
ncbi:Alpha/Beta hydrolase protein [Mycena crocata]|nr:Alpha/Beta hydrolase protein [Mycena crocata]